MARASQREALRLVTSCEFLAALLRHSSQCFRLLVQAAFGSKRPGHASAGALAVGFPCSRQQHIRGSVSNSPSSVLCVGFYQLGVGIVYLVPLLCELTRK